MVHPFQGDGLYPFLQEFVALAPRPLEIPNKFVTPLLRRAPELSLRLFIGHQLAMVLLAFDVFYVVL
jgi:hypothetical protein